MSRVLNIGICDDEQLQIDYVTTLVEKWAPKGVNVIIKEYNSAESFSFHFSEDKSTDILLLDIQMGGIDGMELAEGIRRVDSKLQIIFITGYSDFISRGYDVQALHYLIKPVDEERLFATLDKALLNLGKAEEDILVATEKGLLRLLLQDIIYIEAFAHTIEIHTHSQGVILASVPISKIEQELGQGFVRCHRSYIVGLRHVKMIGKSAVALDNGQEIALSRRLYNQVNMEFIKYYKGDRQ